MGNESELQSKLRVFHERKELAVIEEALGCAQTPGWTRVLRTVLPDPVVLAGDFSTVVGFLELEYDYAVYAATV